MIRRIFLTLAICVFCTWLARRAESVASKAQTVATQVSGDIPAVPSGASEVQQFPAVPTAAPTLTPSNSLKISDLPAGPLRESLASLRTDLQSRVLARIEKLGVPPEDFSNLRASPSGALFYVCDLPAEHAAAHSGERSQEGQRPDTKRLVSSGAASAFALHSKPGALNVVFLDFEGGPITGTQWNTDNKVTTYQAKPYDIDGNASNFDAEKANIEAIWNDVSEDYAPFDIDVTTERPASFGARVGRVLITSSKDANGINMPDSTAGGVAFVDCFGDSDYAVKTSPAFVYFNNLGGSANAIAYTCSHEFGHNLGLTHDGVAGGSAYYHGHYAMGTDFHPVYWAPIMGGGLVSELSQWSKGEYYNSNNPQDDLAVIRSKIGNAADLGGHSIGTALTPQLTTDQFTASGLVRNTTEPLLYGFDAGAGPVSVHIEPQSPGNLDAKIELLDATGAVVANADPAGEVSALLNYTATDQKYFVRVSSSATGDPLSATPTGYTVYGSLGRYTLTGTYVGSKPQIGGALTASALTSVPYQYQIVATNSPTSYETTSLPAGLSLNGTSGLISGSMKVPGDYSIELTARNRWGFDTKTLMLHVAYSTPAFSLETAARRKIVAPGDTVELNPGVSSDDANLTLQWRHKGRPITGASNPTLSLANLSALDEGWYDLVATNSAGTTYSPPMFVVIAPVKPEILSWADPGPHPYYDTIAKRDAILADATSTYGWAIMRDGLNWTWSGATGMGNVGDSTAGVAVAVADIWTCVLKNDGTLGFRLIADRTVGTLPEVVAVRGSESELCVFFRDGTVKGFGNDVAAGSRFNALRDVYDLDWQGGRMDVIYRDGRCESVGDLAPGEARPGPVTGALKVATSRKGSYVLKSDGTVVKMGPTVGTALATDVVDVSAAADFALALKRDGSVVILENGGIHLWNERLTKLTSVVKLSNFCALRESTADTIPSISQQPVDQVGAEAGAVTFSVAANAGTSYLLYQWRKNGTEIPNQSGPTLTLQNLELSDEASYDVVVSSSAGSTTSAGAKLVLGSVFTVTDRSPSLNHFKVGDPLTLFVTAKADAGTLTYQWYHDALPISGATEPTLHFDTTDINNAGAYSVRIAQNQSARTLVMFVRAGTTPTHYVAYHERLQPTMDQRREMTRIGIQLIDTGQLLDRDGRLYDFPFRAVDESLPVERPIYDAGSGFTHYADGSVGLPSSAPKSLLRNLGKVISHKANWEHRFALRSDGIVICWKPYNSEEVPMPNFGKRVTKISVDDSSLLALLEDGTLASWIPDARTKAVPEELSHVIRIFGGALKGAAILDSGEAVSWGNFVPQKDFDISHAVEISFPTVVYDDGSVRSTLDPYYYFPGSTTRVVSANGSAYLREASGDTAPVIDAQPVSIEKGEGTDGSLSIAAHAGTNELVYTWSKDGVPIPNQSTNVLEMPYLQKGDAGTYQVVISNDLGSVTSASVTVKVAQGPTVSSASLPNQIVKLGDKCTLSVIAAGTGTLTYQWSKDNIDIPGATSSQFTINSMTWLDAGRYRVAIKDSVGNRARLFNIVYAPRKTEIVPFGIKLPAVVTQDSYGPIAEVQAEGSNLSILKADGNLEVWDQSVSVPVLKSTIPNVAVLMNEYAIKTDGSVISIYSLEPWTNPASNSWIELSGVSGISSDGIVYRLYGYSSYARAWRPVGNVTSLSPAYYYGNRAVLADGAVLDENDPRLSTSYEEFKPLRRLSYPDYSDPQALRTNGEIWTWNRISGEKRLVATDVVRWYPGIGSYITSNELPNPAWPDLATLSHSYFVSGGRQRGAVLRDPSSDKPISIAVQPQSQTVGENASVVFSVQLNPEAIRYTVQWRKNGVAIDGATGLTYSIPDINANDAGTYDLVVTSRSGILPSQQAKLTLAPVPKLTLKTPARQVVRALSPLQLSAEATGRGAMSYQWYLDGFPIPGAVSSTFRKEKMSAADAGIYRLEARDSNGANSILMRVVYMPLKSKVTRWTYDFSGHGLQVATLPCPATTYSISYSYRFFAASESGSVSEWPGNMPSLLSGVHFFETDLNVALKTDGSVYRSTSLFTEDWSDIGIKEALSVEGSNDSYWILRSNGDLEQVGTYGKGVVKHHVQNYFSWGGGTLLVTHWNGTVSTWPTENTNSHLPESALAIRDAASAYGYGSNGVILKRDGTLVSWMNGIDASKFGPVRRFKKILGQMTVQDFRGEIVPIEGSFQFEPGYYENVLDSKRDNSNYAVLQDTTGDLLPTVIGDPLTVAGHIGTAVTLSASATGENLAYQWFRNGTAISGATSATLVLPSIQNSDAGWYTVTASNIYGSVTSRAAAVSVGDVTPSRIKNMSVRASSGAGGSPLIVGFVMSGGAKNILVRAIGPTLSAFGVSGVMPDPQLVMHSSASGSDMILSTNDNWSDGDLAAMLSSTFASVGAFALSDTTSKDSSLYTPVDGGRTVHVSPITGTQAGVVLVEAYDAGTGVSPHLINVSARNLAGNGSDTLIAGFVIDGTEPKKVLIRGIGPTLAAFGVTGVLADPLLEVHTTLTDSSNQPVDTIVATNDDWQDEPGAAAAFTAAGAFALPAGAKDSAIVVTLPFGAYTAVVRGTDGGTGEALVEVYEVP